MSEEDRVPTVEEAEAALAESFEKEESSTEQPQISEIESKAREMGWRPADELEDGKEFIGPDEFVRNAKLFDKINHYKSEVDKLKVALKELGSHMSAKEEAAYKRALADVEAKKKQALEDYDVEAYAEADKIQKSIDEDFKAVQKTTSVEVDDKTEAVLEFEKRNKDWYNEDNLEMVAYAQSIDNLLSAKNPGMPVEEHLKLVEEKVKNTFASKFKNVNAGRPPAVSSGTKPLNEPVHRGLKYSDLTEHQKMLYNQADSLPDYSKKQYLADLEALGFRPED